MTTTVKVSAHCSAEKQVRVSVDAGVTGETTFLQDGESREFLAFDNRVISVREELKDQQPPSTESTDE